MKPTHSDTCLNKLKQSRVTFSEGNRSVLVSTENSWFKQCWQSACELLYSTVEVPVWHIKMLKKPFSCFEHYWLFAESCRVGMAQVVERTSSNQQGPGSIRGSFRDSVEVSLSKTLDPLFAASAISVWRLPFILKCFKGLID